MMTMTVKDEWVRTAMTDDNVVVELLVRLKQARTSPPAPKPVVAGLKWGIRQPRSKALSMGCDAKRDGDFNVSNRRSPTTPLSWSGGGGSASPSTADGFEETSKQVSRFPPAAPSRSKGTAANETTSTTTKRSRRKKTFAELKEEENLLLKERVSLKKEMASMRATCKEQRARNENLKRIKLDLNLQLAKNEAGGVPSTVGYGPSPSHSLDDRKPPLDSCNLATLEKAEEAERLQKRLCRVLQKSKPVAGKDSCHGAGFHIPPIFLGNMGEEFQEGLILLVYNLHDCSCLVFASSYSVAFVSDLPLTVSKGASLEYDRMQFGSFGLRRFKRTIYGLQLCIIKSPAAVGELRVGEAHLSMTLDTPSACFNLGPLVVPIRLLSTTVSRVDVVVVVPPEAEIVSAQFIHLHSLCPKGPHSLT
ncbi:hypothetical protein V6N12_052721 [Hibiscus sabdariffa]|uniref:Uncharacterized protein n=1 Tax=Hibiscus sabdariffa TaxID=183260 RepID=A0ABR2C2D8_9ROSI